jgi:hypothetical protein
LGWGPNAPGPKQCCLLQAKRETKEKKKKKKKKKEIKQHQETKSNSMMTEEEGGTHLVSHFLGLKKIGLPESGFVRSRSPAAFWSCIHGISLN